MRKESVITLLDGGNELKFKIRQMPATKTESWLIRAALCFAGTGAQNDEDGIQGVFEALRKNPLRLLGSLDYEKARPLYDELLSCCTRIDGKVEIECTPDNLDSFISEVGTLFKLRLEAAKLNFSFFTADGNSASPSVTIKAGGVHRG